MFETIQIILKSLKPFIRKSIDFAIDSRITLGLPIPMFGTLEIETSSYCNRLCPSCIRNSHPDRNRVHDWFNQTLMPTEMVKQILNDAKKMGFNGLVCLQHYNEPLLDERIEQLGQYARVLNAFKEVFLDTNADFLNKERADKLDGLFHRLIISLYMNEPMKSERERWIRSLFSKSKLEFTGGFHIPTHFSPSFDVVSLAKQNENRPCREPLGRMILNHRGDMLLCCEDLLGNFDLGSINTHSISELWYSVKHQTLVKDLRKPGGRRKYPYCRICPRA